MTCILKLKALMFDTISFKRIGAKNENKLNFDLSVNIGTNINDDNMKRVSVKIVGNKQDEYTFEVQASGFFYYEGDANDAIVQQNAVAIVMPYIRSEISLLTAQPEVDSVVLPPFNIVELLKNT